MKHPRLSKDNLLCLPYQGNSMRGTFRIGDFLIIESCTLENLQKGAIIAFRNKREIRDKEMIVHRIIRIDKGYLFTRGDNNKRPDIIPVSNSALVGKVISYDRDGKCYRAIGGLRGLFQARTVNFFRRLIYWFFTKVQWLLPIKLLGNILNKYWKSPIQKIKLSTKEGPVIKWVFRNRTLAYWSQDKKFQRSSFFSRFLINSKNLN